MRMTPGKSLFSNEIVMYFLFLYTTILSTEEKALKHWTDKEAILSYIELNRRNHPYRRRLQR